MPNLLGAERIIGMFPYFTLGFIILILGKFVFQKTTEYCINDELTEKDNPAMGVLLGSYLIGLAIAITSIISVQSTVDSEAIKLGAASIVAYGLMAVALMRLSVVIMDKLILSGFSVHKEITTDKNLGVAFVTGGSCIATGLIIAGVMSGTSDSFVMGFRDVAIYWALGQVILVLGSKAFQALTSYDDQKLLEGSDKAGEMQNIPIGLMWAGFLIAQGLIIKAALTGATSDIVKECVITAVASACGLILFSAVRVVTDKFLLPNSNMSKEISEDHNPAAGIICGVAFIAIALMLTPAINPTINPVITKAEVKAEAPVEVPMTETKADTTTDSQVVAPIAAPIATDTKEVK